jgi:hypothetical protein
LAPAKEPFLRGSIIWYKLLRPDSIVNDAGQSPEILRLFRFAQNSSAGAQTPGISDFCG